MPNTFSAGYKTETAPAPIIRLMPPIAGYIPKFTKIQYRTSGTVHTLSFMRSHGQTKTGEAGATGQKVLNLQDPLAMKHPTTGAGAALTTSDYLVWADENGVYHYDLISAVSASDISVTTNLPVYVPINSDVWIMAAPAEVTHDIWTTQATEVIDRENLTIKGGIPKSPNDWWNTNTGEGSPLLFLSNNASANDGTLDLLCGEYDPAGEIHHGAS